VFQEHYPALVVAYLIGLGGWLAASRVWRTLWPHQPAGGFASPWKEFGLALLGAVGVLAVGQLWSLGVRLPEEGDLGPAFGAVNQALIFAPILLVVVIRRQSWTTAWLSRRRIGWRRSKSLLRRDHGTSVLRISNRASREPRIGRRTVYLRAALALMITRSAMMAYGIGGAQPPPVLTEGDRVRVSLAGTSAGTKADRRYSGPGEQSTHRFAGNFLRVGQDTLFLTGAAPEPAGIPLVSMRRLEISRGRKSQAGRGAVIGRPPESEPPARF
jgi:hypothetical protein